MRDFPKRKLHLIKANKFYTLGVPFKTELKYSDLKGYLDADYLVIFYSKGAGIYRSYSSIENEPGGPLDKEIKPTESFLIRVYKDKKFIISKNKLS